MCYYRHIATLPQETLKVTMQNEPWSDCDDPDRLRELIGFDDRFPYESPMMPVPRATSN